MQEIITSVVVLVALIIMIYKGNQALKSFKKSDSCNGCGCSCNGCPVAPVNRQTKEVVSK
jgi:hypothetical protein